MVLLLRYVFAKLEQYYNVKKIQLIRNKTTPCLNVGDKLIAINGLSLQNISHKVSQNLGEMTKFSEFFSKGGGLFLRGGEMVSHGDSTVK